MASVPEPVLMMRLAAAFLVLRGLGDFLFLYPLVALVIYKGKLIVPGRRVTLLTCVTTRPLQPVDAIVWNNVFDWPFNALPANLGAATESPLKD